MLKKMQGEVAGEVTDESGNEGQRREGMDQEQLFSFRPDGKPVNSLDSLNICQIKIRTMQQIHVSSRLNSG
jgi:hypothetical protein